MMFKHLHKKLRDPSNSESLKLIEEIRHLRKENVRLNDLVKSLYVVLEDLKQNMSIEQ